MELHSLDGQAAMPQPHDLPVLGFGGDQEIPRQRLALDHERVIARGREMILNLRKNAEAVVPYPRNLSMHHRLCPHYLLAERLADRLVAQADAEDRQLAGEPLYERQRDARFVRRA